MNRSTGNLLYSTVLLLLALFKLISLSANALPQTSNAVPPDLQNTTPCTQLGYKSLSKYQQGLPLQASKRGHKSSVNCQLEWNQAPGASSTKHTQSVFLPIFASIPLQGPPNAKITTAVIFLHGLLGDANTYFCAGSAASKLYGSSVAVIAPWFGTTQVSDSCMLHK